MLRAQDDVVALLIRFKTSQAVRRTAAPYRRRLIHSFGGVGTRSSLAMPRKLLSKSVPNGWSM